MTSGRPWADLTHTQAKTEEWCVGGRFQGAKQSRRVRSWEGAVRKAGNRGEQGMSKVRRHPQSRHGRAWGRVAMQAKVPGKAKAVTEKSNLGMGKEGGREAEVRSAHHPPPGSPTPGGPPSW